MTFLDTNVWLYASGPDHPSRDDARRHLRRAGSGLTYVTSAEVVQELLHVALRRGVLDRFETAVTMVESIATVWPLEFEDVLLARSLASRHQHLTSRDLTHLAMCTRHDVDELVTFDRALATAWDHR